MNERIELLTMAAVNELAFDEIIDVRAPEEYAVDHVTGAINLPVLDNDERVRVGTLHQQVSAFEAKKVGASLVSSNIARHLKEHFAKYGKMLSSVNLLLSRRAAISQPRNCAL